MKDAGDSFRTDQFARFISLKEGQAEVQKVQKPHYIKLNSEVLASRL